jgi:lysophospholipase L1-like esterase
MTPKVLAVAWRHRMARGLSHLLALACAGVVPAAFAADTAEAWADTLRYRAENAQLGRPLAEVPRVVFFGDSITERWALPAVPAGSHRQYLNRGISGQTAAQMLLRFRADVLALRPQVVVVLAGTNDIAGNTGPTTVDEIAGHLRSMALLARAEGVRVVLCSVLPAAGYGWRPDLRPAATIVALNARLRAVASELALGWADYHAAMADPQGGLPHTLAEDGVHPGAAGYARMAEQLAPALEAALRD